MEGVSRDVQQSMSVVVSNWPFESEECSCSSDKIALLMRLIDCYIELALIICNENGKVLWANDFSLSVADKWGIFQFQRRELVVTNKKLLNLLMIEPGLRPVQPTHHYFSCGPLFFDVSQLLSSQCHGDTQLIGLAIDCHALEDCENHTLAELSPSEYRLITCLEANHSLKQSSSLLDISYENARTKLKRIFEKLNVHSQRELLAKVRHVEEGRRSL